MKQKQHSQKMWKLMASTVAILISVTTFAFAQQSATVQKKIIEAGWDAPTTASLLKKISQIESSPFDGIILDAAGKDDDGKTVSGIYGFSTTPWKKEWFQSAVNDLNAVHSTKLTDSFLRVVVIPGNVDMFDDAGWKEIVNHWSILAWIAKEGHLKGICLDQEAYTHAQFGYTSQAQHDKHSFAEYQVKARQRGREIINAVASVDPNLVIFTYMMHSINVAAINSTNPQRSLQDSSFGLYPAFISGWLDVAPPTMIFVDGAEDQGYRANSQLDFLAAANMMRNTALKLVAPENRQKYLAQVQASFGIYLDAYINPSTSWWYIDPKGSTPTQRLQTNVEYALNAANEYVWVYGEKYRWWDTQNPTVKPESWESVLPGIRSALLRATKRELKNKQDIDLTDNWRFLPDAASANVALPSYDDSKWKLINAGNWWQWQGYSKYHGVAWYRKTIELPALQQDQKAFLHFDAVDGAAVVYLNGKKIGAHTLGENYKGWNEPFQFEVTDKIVPGKNVIAVQVTSKSLDTASGIQQPVKLTIGTPR
jgi:hypothetical protein